MQLVSRPTDLSVRAPVGRVSDSLQKSALGLGVPLILFDQSTDGLRHKTGHGLIAGGCVNTQLSQQRLRETERYILVSLHVFQCITWTREALLFLPGLAAGFVSRH